MKKWYKSLSKEQIQRYVFLGLLILVFAAFFISLSIASSNEKNQPTKDPIEQPNTDNSGNNNQNDNNNDNNNNNENTENNETPKPEPKVETFSMPIEGDFMVVRKYYDINDSQENQELAVIQFGKKYFTSNGVALANKENTDFNVLSALSGEVLSVDESPIYGVVVTMKHENDIITEYSSLSKATVKVGDVVTQGAEIGVSGVCEYDSELGSHIYFKVMKNDTTYNPEKVIGQSIEDVLK